MPARYFLLAVFFAHAAFLKAEAQQAPFSADAISDADNRNGLEQETFCLINQYRQESKLPPLQWDVAIAKVARAHSRDMSTGEVDFGHDGFGDRVKELRTVLIGLNGAGENVLKTDDPNQLARSAVALWLKSPHHLKNIRGDYNYSGLGVWEDKEGMVYFTQIFVKLPPAAQESQAASPPPITSPFGMLIAPPTHARP